MNKSSCILLLVLATALVAQSAHLGQNENGIDIYTIDISKPAKYRFQEVSVAYKDRVKVVLEHYLSLVPDFLVDIVGYIGHAIQIV